MNEDCPVAGAVRDVEGFLKYHDIKAILASQISRKHGARLPSLTHLLEPVGSQQPSQPGADDGHFWGITSG